jgi:hypothetical protein
MPTPEPTGEPAPTDGPEPTLGAVEDGTAQVITSGDVTANVVLPMDVEMAEFPSGDGSFDLRWQDDELNTLNITIDVAAGEVTSAFVGIGVPGTAIVDDDYFADFLRLECEVDVSRMDATEVEGTFACLDISNGADTKAIDAIGSFSAVP